MSYFGDIDSPDRVRLDVIWNESCVDTMQRMPEGFVDLTVTSPPYDDIRVYGGHSWNWSVFEAAAKALYRVTKDRGVVVWVVSDQTKEGDETGTSFRQALYFKKVGFKLFDTMIYVKNGCAAVGSTKTYWGQFEYMFVLSKGLPKTINLIKDKKNKKPAKAGKQVGRRKRHGSVEKRYLPKDGLSYGRRTNVWEYTAGYGHTSKDNAAWEHPALFPEKLARDHIVSWSNPGDIIYDPFGGGGTTAKMAKMLSRHFVASEIEASYCDIIQERLAAVDRSGIQIDMFD